MCIIQIVMLKYIMSIHLDYYITDVAMLHYTITITCALYKRYIVYKQEMESDNSYAHVFHSSSWNPRQEVC